jgi:hypothetical protein
VEKARADAEKIRADAATAANAGLEAANVVLETQNAGMRKRVRELEVVERGWKQVRGIFTTERMHVVDRTI